MLEPVVRYLPAYTELYRRIQIILKVEKLLRLLCLMMSSIPEFIVTSSQTVYDENDNKWFIVVTD